MNHLTAPVAAALQAEVAGAPDDEMPVYAFAASWVEKQLATIDDDHAISFLDEYRRKYDSVMEYDGEHLAEKAKELGLEPYELAIIVVDAVSTAYVACGGQPTDAELHMAKKMDY